MNANGKTSENYISKVHLKGYKSIQDVEIDLLPGMNTMIGPNGSGKTNFLEFLDKAVKYDRTDLDIGIEAEIKFVLGDGIYNLNVFYENKEESITVFEGLRFDFGIKFNLSKNGLEEPNLNPKGLLFKNNTFFYRTLFSIPKNLIGCNLFDSLKFKIHDDKSLFVNYHSTFVESNFSLIVYQKVKEKLQEGLSNNKLKKTSFKNFEIKKVTNNLKYFSPIKDMRVSEAAKLVEIRKSLEVNYFSFEFFVNGDWLAWNQLSDGTRRLFYMISELSVSEKGIYLIDEPELGLHPHQLHLLMLFLKEQAEDKQIIIATHSPQVLDFLKLEELNRLIIARSGVNGTELVRLSDEEKGHFKDALELGLDFSDYWLQSGIQAENIE